MAYMKDLEDRSQGMVPQHKLYDSTSFRSSPPAAGCDQRAHQVQHLPGPIKCRPHCRQAHESLLEQMCLSVQGHVRGRLAGGAELLKGRLCQIRRFPDIGGGITSKYCGSARSPKHTCFILLSPLPFMCFWRCLVFDLKYLKMMSECSGKRGVSSILGKI